jgi:lysophospholipase L1-like esterase
VTVNPPPQLSFTRFVAFGDSITRGEDGNITLTAIVSGALRFFQDVVLAGREYPTVLQQELQARYTLQSAQIVVANAGNPGEALSDSATLSRFNAALGGNQAVLLMEGSNDLYLAYYDSSPTPRINVAISNLQTMISRAQASNVRPYLATIPPMYRDMCSPACRGWAEVYVPGYNDRVRSLAASNGLALVDVYQAFNGDRTLLSGDGLHPNAAGYQKIADTFFDAIRATAEAPTLTTGGRRPGPGLR